MSAERSLGTASLVRELLAINRVITSSLDHNVVLDTVTRQSAALLDAEAAVLLLREDATMHVSASFRLGDAVHGTRVAVGAGLMATIRELALAAGLPGFLGVPLVLRGETIGLLAVYRRDAGYPADHAEDVLSALADQAAIALENARIHEQATAHARALGDSEERFRLALEEAPIGIALVGLDGRFLRVNKVLCDMLGYTHAELTAMRFQDVTHPDDVDADVALARQLARGEIPRYQLGKRYLRKDGACVDAMLSGSIVRSSTGAPLYYIAHVEDVTERKRQATLVARAQQRFELALEGANLAAWDWNLVTAEVVLSPRWSEMRGDPPRERTMEVTAWFADIHPDDRAAVQRAIDDHLGGRTSTYESEHRVRTRDSGWRWVLERGRVIEHDAQGRATRVAGTALDITARKEAEREHARLLEQLQTVLDKAPVGILLTHDGRTWQANVRAQLLWGRAVATAHDASDFFDALLDRDEHVVAQELQPGARALAGEEIDALELSVRRPDGTLVPVVVHAAQIPGHADRPTGAVVAFEDITWQKRLEHLRSEWSSIIAHDLRQPLNSIILSAELIASPTSTLAPVQQRARRIAETARRLHRMIEDLMDFSRLEARQLRLHRELRDARTLVTEATESCKPSAGDRAIELRMPSAPVMVAVDPDRFAQIMENLLSNAVKYGAPGTPIHVDVETTRDTLSVSVINHGPGVAPDLLPVLFERFRTGTEARRTGIKSIGLGLYITRGLVEAHGGQLTIESTPGATTTLRFVLPRADQVESSPGLHP